MALRGKALEFAKWLEDSLSKREIYLSNLEKSEIAFEEALKEQLSGYTEESAGKTASKLRGYAEKNLKKIEEFCNKCFSYHIDTGCYSQSSGVSYFNIRRHINREYPHNSTALSGETTKLAKALYLGLVLKDFTSMEAKAIIPAVVYTAANLCEEWRSSPQIVYAYYRTYKIRVTHTAIRMRITECFYKLLPELREILPEYLALSHLPLDRKNGNKRA